MTNNTTDKKLKKRSKRDIILLYILGFAVLVVLILAIKWSIDNLLFKDFFKSYKF